MDVNTFTSISLDTVFITVLALFFFVFVWRFGAARIHLFTLSLPLAILLTMVAPFKGMVANILTALSLNAGGAPILIFTAGVGVSIWLLRSVILEISNKHRIKQALIIAAANTALLMVIFYHFVPIDVWYDFGPEIDALFTPVSHAFWVTLVSYFAIGFARKV